MKFFWVTIITIIAGLIQLFFYKSIELVVILFSINFMVFGLELTKTRSKRNILLKIENIERNLNDTVSNLISPQIIKVEEKRKEIVEWLNRF
jgi:c-di-AMP phosphodiesterase-like protein